MTITDFLNKIKSEKYVQKITDAIHDAIKQTYEDATKEGNANMEVSAARGTHSTLKGRLDKTDDEVENTTRQLAQKAKRKDVFLKDDGININDFDEPTRETFLEQQGIDVNYILGDNNVSPRNTTFLTKVEEINEIAKAKVASTTNEFVNSTTLTLLKNHNIGANGTLTATNTFDVLKIPVKQGDVIRSKLYFHYNKQDSSAGLYYVAFLRADGSFLSEIVARWHAHASTNIVSLKANGVTAPVNAAFCYVAIANRYYYNNDMSEATNGKKAEIITLNRNAEITNYVAEAPVDDYVPVGDPHYLFDNDVKIPRYDQELQGIKDILASLVDAGGD